MQVRSMKELEPLTQKAKEECEMICKLIYSLQGNIGRNHIGNVVVQDAYRKLKKAESKSEEIVTSLETKRRTFLQATSLKEQLTSLLSNLDSFYTVLYPLILCTEHRQPLAVGVRIVLTSSR